MRLSLTLLLMGAAGCSTSPVSTQALLVTVEFSPSSRSRCAMVRVSDGVTSKSTAAMVRADQTLLSVAIFRDELPEEVMLTALGFADEACTEPLERSAVRRATFAGPLTRVPLGLEGDGVVQADGGVDAGREDAGGEDAGTQDAGVDAGEPDAGEPDAGFDAGLDAGVELCANRMDDNGNGLADCADPGCADGVTCDDGDLCSTGDQCSGQVCTKQLNSCTGPVASCMVPTGCDAGMCLSGPAPAFSSCDAGGRCDGAGRCAPFCDSSRASLRVCYQFEGALTDGSGKGNSATGSSFSYDAGVRGLAWVSGNAGLDVRDHSSLDCTTAVTMEAWVRLTAFPDAGRYGIFDNDGVYSAYVGPGGELRCQGQVNVNVPSALTLSTWQHIGCIQGNGTMKAYRNGVEIGSASTTGSLGTGNANGLHVGENSPNGDVLRGSLDGVRIWCEALNPAELCTVPGDCG